MEKLGTIPLDEIKCHPDTNDPENLFKILHRAFGDCRTWCVMLQQFTSMHQFRNETVRIFSHRLFNAWQAIERAQTQRGCQIVTSHLLTDVFVTGLLDSMLKKILRQDLFENPNITIYDLREKAIRWDAIVPVKDQPLLSCIE